MGGSGQGPPAPCWRCLECPSANTPGGSQSPDESDMQLPCTRDNKPSCKEQGQGCHPSMADGVTHRGAPRAGRAGLRLPPRSSGRDKGDTHCCPSVRSAHLNVTGGNSLRAQAENRLPGMESSGTEGSPSSTAKGLRTVTGEEVQASPTPRCIAGMHTPVYTLTRTCVSPRCAQTGMHTRTPAPNDLTAEPNQHAWNARRRGAEPHLGLLSVTATHVCCEGTAVHFFASRTRPSASTKPNP